MWTYSILSIVDTNNLLNIVVDSSFAILLNLVE